MNGLRINQDRFNTEMKDYGKNIENQISLPPFKANDVALDDNKKWFGSQHIDKERAEGFKNTGNLNHESSKDTERALRLSIDHPAMAGSASSTKHEGSKVLQGAHQLNFNSSVLINNQHHFDYQMNERDQQSSTVCTRLSDKRIEDKVHRVCDRIK